MFIVFFYILSSPESYRLTEWSTCTQWHPRSFVGSWVPPQWNNNKGLEVKIAGFIYQAHLFSAWLAHWSWPFTSTFWASVSSTVNWGMVCSQRSRKCNMGNICKVLKSRVVYFIKSILNHYIIISLFIKSVSSHYFIISLFNIIIGFFTQFVRLEKFPRSKKNVPVLVPPSGRKDSKSK